MNPEHCPKADGVKHPGFEKLKPEAGVYRCKLLPAKKREPKQADYTGVLKLENCLTRIYIWVHDDGSLGLRLAKIVNKPKETK